MSTTWWSVALGASAALHPQVKKREGRAGAGGAKLSVHLETAHQLQVSMRMWGVASSSGTPPKTSTQHWLISINYLSLLFPPQSSLRGGTVSPPGWIPGALLDGWVRSACSWYNIYQMSKCHCPRLGFSLLVLRPSFSKDKMTVSCHS